MSTVHPRSRPTGRQAGNKTQAFLLRTVQHVSLHPMVVGVVGTGIAIGLATWWLHGVQLTLPNASVIILGIVLGLAGVAASWVFSFGLRGQGGNAKKLQRLDLTDALTGLANRRRLELHLTREGVRAQRQHTPLSVLFIDIDHFKVLNDSLGHAAGSDVLVVVANAISEAARRGRPVDFVARYGGEEFVVVLPRVSADVAKLTAMAIRAHVQARGQLGAGYACVTVSIGCATCFPGEGFTHTDLLEAAEQQMQVAKQGGRNRVSATLLDKHAATV